MLPKCDLLLLKLEQLILDVLSVFSEWAFSPFDNSFWIKVWKALLYYFVLLYAVVRAHPCNHNSSFDGIFFLHFIIPSHSGTVHLRDTAAVWRRGCRDSSAWRWNLVLIIHLLDVELSFLAPSSLGTGMTPWQSSFRYLLAAKRYRGGMTRLFDLLPLNGCWWFRS
jgi:hypothetical protein